MTLLERLRIRLGLSSAPDTVNIVIDDIHARFLDRIQHREGNAVQLLIRPGMFTEANIAEMMGDDLIYSWHYETIEGSLDLGTSFVLYSDKNRLSRFDPEVLRTIEKAGIAVSMHTPWAE